MSAPLRSGLSRIEVVVIVFIGVLLVALVLPALQQRHGPSRRSECLNHLRNVGLAVQNYASSHAGTLPPLEDGAHGWPRALLVYLDQPALDREIASEGWSPEKAPHLPVFTCPQDEDSFQKPGGLSYVVNGGYGFFPVDRETGAVREAGRHSPGQDWDGDGAVSDEDRLVTKATGVVWRPDEAVKPMTLDFIATGDGLGQTLLLAENLHAGPWTTRDVRGLAFVVGRGRLAFDPEAGRLAVAKADLGPFGVNGAKEAEGLVPGPSSNHREAASVGFADGRCRTVSEGIDPLVYVRLVTSAGSLYGQKPVGEGKF